MLRNAIAFVVGFIVLGAVGFIGFNLFGDAMLRAAEWRPGVMPPASYVWATLATDLTGSILAGALVAWIAGKSSHKVALALVLLVAAISSFPVRQRARVQPTLVRVGADFLASGRGSNRVVGKEAVCNKRCTTRPLLTTASTRPLISQPLILACSPLCIECAPVDSAVRRFLVSVHHTD